MSAEQQASNETLPLPDSFSLEISQELSQKIHQSILDNGGSIGFDQYMQMALFEAGHGYYSAGASKIGEAGDFVTAPEISPLFSKCLAKQCQQLIEHLSSEGVPEISILEFGPGKGTMAIDILLELERNNALPDIYYLLEPSPDLRERQQANIKQQIAHLEDKIVFLETLPEQAFDGIILANEVIDAMPVKRFIFDDGLHEYGVSCIDDKEAQIFAWDKKEFSQQEKEIVINTLGEIEPSLPRPYVSEINLNIQPWLTSLSTILNRGLILISDYGYPRHEFYHPQRDSGTLICHYRHRAHDDPFLYPGLQDITASVDFTAVAEAAVENGLNVSGFTTQAHFLMSCGLDEFLIAMETEDVSERAKLTNEVSQLTLPGEMGEKFKFIALSKSIDLALKGFEFVDQRARL